MLVTFTKMDVDDLLLLYASQRNEWKTQFWLLEILKNCIHTFIRVRRHKKETNNIQESCQHQRSVGSMFYPSSAEKKTLKILFLCCGVEIQKDF